ncbi:hypothetical protein IWW34DRAFT_637051, partial [Fusarium oxysporum f. sp. albedinis]
SNTCSIYSHQWRASQTLSPKWHFPTHSQPYGSFKHIILDIKAGSSGKFLYNCCSI